MPWRNWITALMIDCSIDGITSSMPGRFLYGGHRRSDEDVGQQSFCCNCLSPRKYSAFVILKFCGNEKLRGYFSNRLRYIGIANTHIRCGLCAIYLCADRSGPYSPLSQHDYRQSAAASNCQNHCLLKALSVYRSAWSSCMHR